MTKLTTAIVKRTWNWTFNTPGDDNTPGDNNNPGGTGKNTGCYMEEEKEEH